MLRSLRRAVQAAADQAGRHPGWRGQGAGQPQAAWGGGAQSEHNLSVTDKIYLHLNSLSWFCPQVRVPDAVPQQHDRPEACAARLAGGGWGRQAGPGGN